MGNMGYCRFQNALSDLHECKDHLDENPNKILSEDEWEAFLEMIELCGKMHNDYVHLLE